ncbi:MAG TPA: DUF4291 domain-containing protein [Moraxellaceae bacterium]|nr:DUF4291 domain-containing protein [Moraxellaceae bacterium]
MKEENPITQNLLREARRPAREIRATYDADTIRVYQAYRDAIADSALLTGRFVSPPFSMSRMTWIKPSFLWMMYRAGWGLKDAGQTRVLAIDIRREGFEWALAHSCLSHAPEGMGAGEWIALKARTPVRIQWDPERDLSLQPLEHRSVQVGLSGEAAYRYVHEWTCRITDITAEAHAIHALVAAGDIQAATARLPRETAYPLAPALAAQLGMKD